MAVNTNSNTTPGPPLDAAVPIPLKIPAPITAATPKKVRSRTPRTFLSPIEWPSPIPDWASWRILGTDFFRKSWFGISVDFGTVKIGKILIEAGFNCSLLNERRMGITIQKTFTPSYKKQKVSHPLWKRFFEWADKQEEYRVGWAFVIIAVHV